MDLNINLVARFHREIVSFARNTLFFLYHKFKLRKTITVRCQSLMICHCEWFLIWNLPMGYKELNKNTWHFFDFLLFRFAQKQHDSNIMQNTSPFYWVSVCCFFRGDGNMLHFSSLYTKRTRVDVQKLQTILMAKMLSCEKNSYKMTIVIVLNFDPNADTPLS